MRDVGSPEEVASIELEVGMGIRLRPILESLKIPLLGGVFRDRNHPLALLMPVSLPFGNIGRRER